MANKDKLKVLMVENSEHDVEQVMLLLARGGFQTEHLQITSIEALQNALSNHCWDLILSDYDLPQLTVHDVLRIVREKNLNIPLIILSSHTDETAAEHIMALGAYDFMMKHHSTRLVPVIRRMLNEAENHQRFIVAQSALQKSEVLFQAITANLPSVVFQFLLTSNGETSFLYASDASETLLGLRPEKLIDYPGLFPELILPDDRESYCQSFVVSAEQLSTWDWEGCIQVKGDSDIKWISLRATPRRIDNEATVWDGIMINITRNKLAEREIARSREQLAELSSYMQKVKEQERARIAREIHDDIGGTLTAIKCELFPCIDRESRAPEFYQQKMKSVESLVDRVIDSTRRISLDLRPGILDCGIVAAVQWQAKEFSARTGIACKVSCDSDDITLDSDLAIAIFRIFQEALTNISKHAGASQVHVTLTDLDQLILLEIGDNGRGITNTDMEKHDSFGIRGMRERCQQLKGSFYISGGPNEGTKVTILISKGDNTISAREPIDFEMETNRECFANHSMRK
ncbi:PAS domain S-box-containing protein [Nitrosomonas sp. PY1]|uniref:histidine kinase n=1 Tax=Nitrosomonas sp. PY1 TaxID=1803906 RepID=UPI001FC890DC|nr:histidine kinase [Nitrosomonas sp. PY1]GKS68302.1 PAS domain S-box-containing protein [Nitrosomonas sp. PY1]